MSNIVDGMTERWLADAGIAAGMRVLDFGCGRGDVTFMVARRVGADGKVLGVDRDPRPLEVARERVRELGVTNVSFVEGNTGGPSPDEEPFDAVVGRRVLMYQPDPLETVRYLARVLRPGGLLFFHEHDSISVPGQSPLPLHEQVRGWFWRTVQREGADVHMGFNLASLLTRAGLAVEQVRSEAVVLTPTTRYPIGTIARALLPRIVAQGVATESEVDVDTLDARLIEERRRADATYIWEMVFCAWARKSEQASEPVFPSA